LGKEKKFVWVVTDSFTHSFFTRTTRENRGEEHGSWSNKAERILEHTGVFLEHFGAGN
jgi:hypothetical protein